MVFTPIFLTGFEMGTLSFSSSNIRVVSGSTVEIRTGGVSYTGDYGLYINGSGHVQQPLGGAQSEAYQSVWVDPSNAGDEDSIISFVLADGNTVFLRYRTGSNTWDAYVGGSNIASGSVESPDGYHNVQVYLLSSDSGSIQTKVDGIDDINYSGDTKPGTSTVIEYCRLQQSATSGPSTYFDNWVFGDDGWPGDWRFDKSFPNGDTATEDWILSTGTDSYVLLDEAPPDDNDYIYTTTNSDQTIVDLEDWSGSGFTPQAVMMWARAQKDSASGQQLKIIDSDGTNTNVGSAQDILTSWSYVFKFRTTAPDGGAWTDTDVDNLQVGVEASI